MHNDQRDTMSSPKMTDHSVDSDDFSVVFSCSNEVHDPVSFLLLEESPEPISEKQIEPKVLFNPTKHVASSPVRSLPQGEDGASVKEEQDPSPEQVRTNRTRMTILHYILVYPQWSISLFLFFASLTTSIPSAQDQIWAPLENLRVVVDHEAMLYYDCVQSGFQNHDMHMNQAVLLEQERVTKVRTEVVRPRVDQIISSSSKCFNATQLAQRALQTWQNVLRLEIPDKTTWNSTDNLLCTPHDRQVLSDLLSRDSTTVHDNVQGIFSAYAEASLKSMQKLVLYSKERSSYDYNYFVGLKMQATLQLLDHFAFPIINVQLPEQRLMLELRAILQDLLDALRGAYVHIDVLSTRLLEFEASVSAFRVNYMDLYGRFALINGFVSEFLPSGITLPNYFDVSGVPFPDSLLPNQFFIPSVIGGLPNIDDLAFQYIGKALQVIAQVLQDAAQEATNHTRHAINELFELLRNVMLLEDYDPPKYPQTDEVTSLDDEIGYLTKISESLKTDLFKVLDAIKNRPFDAPNIDPFTSDNTNISFSDKNQTKFDFLDLTYPEIGVPKWLLKMLGFILSYGFLIECCTQAYRLRSLRRKYEKSATPELPNIDYLVESEDSVTNEESNVYRVQAAQSMLIKHLMNPWVIIGLILSPTIILILFCWFPHVKSSCITSRQGTFLARKVFAPVLINKANSQGYALHVAAQAKCFSRQRSLCNTQIMASDSYYRADLEMLHMTEARFNESTFVRTVIDRCVNVNDLDERFTLNCCGLEGYSTDSCSPGQQWQMCPIDTNAKPPASFQPIGDLVVDPSCIVDFGDYNFMQDSLFDCSVIQEACSDAPCSGVNEDLIQRMIIEADCSIESYCISVCIFLALAVYHAIMINVMNKFFFDGLLQIQWKRFKPDGIKLITQINGDGQMVKGGDIQERAARVDRVMKRYVLAGYVQLGMGVIVFTIWAKTFFALNQATARWNVGRG